MRAFAVVMQLQHQPSSLALKLNVSLGALGVPGDVVDGFLKNQQHLAACFGSQMDVSVINRRFKAESDMASRKDIAGEAPHSLHQIKQMVSLRIHCPDDVAHRI